MWKLYEEGTLACFPYILKCKMCGRQAEIPMQMQWENCIVDLIVDENFVFFL